MSQSRRRRNQRGRAPEAPTSSSPKSPTKGNAEAVLEAATAGAGESLPYLTEMEALFGEDLSDTNAFLGQEDLLGIRANAATDGSGDLAFAEATPAKRTVAEEVGHHLQARLGTGGQGVSDPSGSVEQEAGRAAGQVAAGRQVGPMSQPLVGAGVFREEAQGVSADKSPGEEQSEDEGFTIPTTADEAATAFAKATDGTEIPLKWKKEFDRGDYKINVEIDGKYTLGPAGGVGGSAKVSVSGSGKTYDKWAKLAGDKNPEAEDGPGGGFDFHVDLDKGEGGFNFEAGHFSAGLDFAADGTTASASANILAAVLGSAADDLKKQTKGGITLTAEGNIGGTYFWRNDGVNWLKQLKSNIKLELGFDPMAWFDGEMNELFDLSEQADEAGLLGEGETSIPIGDHGEIGLTNEMGSSFLVGGEFKVETNFAPPDAKGDQLSKVETEGDFYMEVHIGPVKIKIKVNDKGVAHATAEERARMEEAALLAALGAGYDGVSQSALAQFSTRRTEAQNLNARFKSTLDHHVAQAEGLLAGGTNTTLPGLYKTTERVYTVTAHEIAQESPNLLGPHISANRRWQELDALLSKDLATTVAVPHNEDSNEMILRHQQIYSGWRQLHYDVPGRGEELAQEAHDLGEQVLREFPDSQFLSDSFYRHQAVFKEYLADPQAWIATERQRQRERLGL